MTVLFSSDTIMFVPFPSVSDRVSNTSGDAFIRVSGRIVQAVLDISMPVGANVVNVFQVTGAVRILNQYGAITEVTRLDDLTAVYATLYNGTTAFDLTANGADFSGVGPGTFFLKDQVATQPYSVVPGTTGGVNEIISDRNAGRPFNLVQKYGADTFLQLRATAGTATQVFKLFISFEYLIGEGSNFELLL